MIQNDTEVRVRYGEVDMMGYLYHSHYVELFDMGRNNLLRDLGHTYAQVEADGVMMPVLQVHIDYKNPAHYDDMLVVRTTLRELPRGVRVTFHYEVFRAEGMQLLTTGSVTLAFMDSVTHRPVRPPKTLLAILAPHFND